jgi:hypothetical protein
MNEIAASTQPGPDRLVYLGISGVLHPSYSTYEFLYGRTADEDGHRKYEAVEALDRALAPWPGAKIILTSTQPWAKGLPAVLAELGPLAPRVVSFTFKDLTERVPFGSRARPISEMDYWRLNKSQVVQRHVAWLEPRSWIALDDEDILWPDEVAQRHLVLTHGGKGLLDPVALDRLVTVLEANFGAPPARR